MNIKSIRYAIVALITFIIVFLFSYVGNNLPDKIEQSLMNAGAGVLGLTIGMWFVYKNSKDDTHHDFD
jgi:amino acid permease